MKRVLILLIMLVAIPVQAGFFDDFFSSTDDQNRDRGPFYFRITDDLKNDAEVSFQDRKLRIRMFFYTQYYNAINTRDQDDLARFFNSNLEVTTQKVKDGPKDKLGQGLEFKFKDLPVQRINNRYSLIVFESTKIKITESQKLIFKFDQNEFAQELGITINQNTYRKTFNYKPLTVELKDLELVNQDGVIHIQGDFKSAFDIDADQEELSFELFRKGKNVKTTARKFGRNFNLTPSLVNETGDFLTKVSAGNYRINVPIELNLSSLSFLSRFVEGRIFNVKVPLLIDTVTSSGLELKIKALVKTKLSDFISNN